MFANFFLAFHQNKYFQKNFPSYHGLSYSPYSYAAHHPAAFHHSAAYYTATLPHLSIPAFAIHGLPYNGLPYSGLQSYNGVPAYSFSSLPSLAYNTLVSASAEGEEE